MLVCVRNTTVGIATSRERFTSRLDHVQSRPDMTALGTCVALYLQTHVSTIQWVSYELLEVWESRCRK
jgi:hypothetical protein